MRLFEYGRFTPARPASVGCVAYAADAIGNPHRMDNEQKRVIRRYDSHAKELSTGSAIREPNAREAWLKAIRDYEEVHGYSSFGRSVAIHYGWMERNESVERALRRDVRIVEIAPLQLDDMEIAEQPCTVGWEPDEPESIDPDEPEAVDIGGSSTGEAEWLDEGSSYRVTEPILAD